MLYGRLVRQPEDEFSRRVALEPGGCKPIDWHPKRTVGRPCLRWPKCVYELGLSAFNGNELEFQRQVSAPGPCHWKNIVSKMAFTT